MGLEVANLTSEMLEDRPGSYTRTAFESFLRERYDHDVNKWKAAWGIELKRFSDVVSQRFHRLHERCPGAQADLEAFDEKIVDRYIEMPAQACKLVDQHHLNLGLRFAWIASDLFYRIGQHVDVFSLNNYRERPDGHIVDEVLKRCNKPVMIGEFHFGALDRGLTGTGLRGVAKQKDRAIAYRTYVEQAAAHPGIIGCHYFTLNDQPALGRTDGECWQIGFVDVCHQPYAELTRAATATHEDIYAVMSGERPPSEEQARFITPIAV